MYVTNFKALYILLNILNDTPYAIFFKTFLNSIDIKIIMCLKWNLSARIKRLCQIVKAYLLLLNNIFLNILKQQNVFTNCNWTKFIAF